jgi:nucleotide-binding universal stress UspA family protein
MGSPPDGRSFAERRSWCCHREKGRTVNEPIVCGVDGSPDSQLALDVAAQLAHRLGTRLIVANVVAYVPDPVVPAFAYAPMARPTDISAPMTEWRTDHDVEASDALLERIVAEAGVEGAELRTIFGIPAERLAELADDEGAELIVVGSRGRGAFRAAFLGSVSNSLVGVAHCPVLIVPPSATTAQ